MVTDETKKIMSLAVAAEAKKRQIEDELKQLQKKRDGDKARFLRDELLISKMQGDSDSEVIKTMHLQKTINDTKQKMNEDHELAELKKKRADVEKKVSEINHWTGQAEYENADKRSEAVSLAQRTFDSI